MLLNHKGHAFDLAEVQALHQILVIFIKNEILTFNVTRIDCNEVFLVVVRNDLAQFAKFSERIENCEHLVS